MKSVQDPSKEKTTATTFSCLSYTVIMQLQTLGGLHLSSSGFSRSKPLLLLCYLAIEGSQPRRLLADLFFFGSKNPRDALSTSYRRLKKINENLVTTDADHLKTSIHCDTNELLKELDAKNYQEALAMYRGSFLTGLDLYLGEELEEWVFVTREYIATRVRQAQFSLSETQLSKGQISKAAKLAENALGLDGAAELEPDDYARAYRILSFTKNPKAAALKTEAEAFGIALSDNDPINASAEAVRVPNNVLLPSRSFVGRDPERLEIAHLLAEPHVRLLTLHGPGGVGKSSLATQAALEQIQEARFKDGVFFVALDTLTKGNQIPLAIASAFGIHLDGKTEPSEQLETHLRNLHVLVVLDNYEHLIDHAMFVSELIEASSSLKIIVTSRERLNLAEEHVLPLKGLSLPANDSNIESAMYSDALLLLVERAKKTKLDFELTPDLFPQAVKLCKLLEGLPLGIELAMSWLKLMPLTDILAELEKNLDFLESPARNAIKRHQSIRAVFENSWALLSAKEQLVLRKLAVFKGGFRREAASSIANATLATLAGLVDKSLIRVSPSGRYSMHALLYQFSHEKLSEVTTFQEEIQHLHLVYYRTFIQKASVQLRSAEQALWLSRIEEEYDNLSNILAFGLQHDAQAGLDVATSLGSFWEMRGRFIEGRHWLKQYLAHTEQLPSQTPVHAKALNNAAWLAFLQADYDEAVLLDKKSLAISESLNDKQGIANALTGLGVYLSDQGDHASAQEYFENCLAINQELKDQKGIASLMNNLGIVHSHLANYEMAEDYHKQSLLIRKQLGDERGVGFTLNNLGLLAYIQADFQSAKTYFSEGLELKQSLEDRHGIAAALDNLGAIEAELGRYEKARSHFSEAMKLMFEMGDKRGVAHCLQNVASLQAFERDNELAAFLWGAAENLREDIGIQLSVQASSKSSQTQLMKTRKALGESLFLSAWNKGKKISFEEAVSYALDKTRVTSLPPQT